MKTEREMFLEWHYKQFKQLSCDGLNDEDSKNLYERVYSHNHQDLIRTMEFNAWLSSASRQGYKFVPVDLLKRCISYIATAECHPNNSKQDEELMANDMELIEDAMIGKGGINKEDFTDSSYFSTGVQLDSLGRLYNVHRIVESDAEYRLRLIKESNKCHKQSVKYLGEES